MATRSFTLTATAGNDSQTINEPNSNDQWKYVWNGLAGTDSLSFDRLPKSDFTIYKDATGIHVDSVSTASHMIYVTLNNVETLKFSDGATTVNLSALFDTVAPTLISASPEDEAVAVPLASNLILTFSETVQRGTGNIVLRNAGGTVIETYNAANSPNLSVSAAVLTVNPTANLSPGTSYYLELAAGTITDAAGNAYAGTQIYNFTTVNGNNLPTGSVIIAGTATQGQQLTASNTLADLDGLGVISYQWKADGTAISGATSSTYTLTQAEVGKAITVTASYSDAQGTSESKTSAATSAVLNVNDLPTGSVSIAGTATQGQQLTASNTLADLDGLGVISYQWKADGTAITGATSSTHTLTQTEVGKAITVTASYSDAQGTSESKTSAATSAVLNVNDLPTGSVSITGTATQGQQLTASNTLADLDGLGVISYQWKADGTAISGATSRTYTLTQAEVGKVMTVTASYSDAQGTPESKTSSSTVAVLNVNALPTGSVNIVGTATQGQQLTASNTLADLDGLGVISYQWKADGTSIGGATASTYTLTQTEVGKAITVTASYSDAQGTSESKTSAATMAVLNVNDSPTGSVSITGSATQGQQLTASNTLADLDGLGVISYQWKADGTSIGGATSSTYTLTQAEVGKAMTVTASYDDAQGTSESKTSAATTAVLNVNDLPTGSVNITGTATQGQQLTASHTLADLDGLGVISYQWKANGTSISDATSSTYTLTQSEVGKAITVTASYSDAFSTAESVASRATDPVAQFNNAPSGSVSVSGTLTQGQLLTASNTLSDLDGLGVISYQWKADGTAISDATLSTYTLTQAEVGKAITVTASYSDAQGTSESKTSATTSAVLNVNDLPTGSVSITGSATQGQQLTVSHTLADLDGLGVISYQWKADGTAIPGAMSSTYTLTQAEVGKAITVTASYSDAFSTAESVASSATDPVVQFNNAPSGSVSVSGTLTQGQLLTASNTLSDLDGLGVISYQWKADGTAISGATSRTYTLTQAEVGKAITVTASYSDAQGTSESKTSAATSAVLNVNDLPTGSVSITGSATQGQQLMVSHTLADLDGLGVVSYQWKADGTAIPGAASSTYTLTQAEVGKAITVMASYSDVQGTPESKTSVATRAVLNTNDSPAILGKDIMPSITMGVSNAVATLSVMDVDGDILRLTLLASEGVLFLPVWTMDEDVNQAGLQLSGLAEELNALLKKLHFAPTTTNAALTVEVSDVHGATDSQVHRFRVDVPANYNSQDGDADGISTPIELAVPGLRTESNAGLTGDGNGDGVLDFYQVNVSSALMQNTGSSGLDSQTYATLVAGSVMGKSDDASGLVITSVVQGINLQDLPTAMSAPIGKFEFTVNLTTPGNTEHFSIYVDEALAVNGYWKATPEGIWVNLASALYGGQIVTEGGRTRLDFSITDGGVFDDDHAINGQISDPGVVGALTVSLIGSHPHPVIDDFWF